MCQQVMVSIPVTRMTDEVVVTNAMLFWRLDDDFTDLTTPVGIGNVAGAEVVNVRETDVSPAEVVAHNKDKIRFFG